MDTRAKVLELEEVGVIYTNFSGRPGKWNEEGDRSFAVIFRSEEEALKHKAEGLNVKQSKDYGDGSDRYYFLPVAVNFNYHTPPHIEMISGSSKTPMSAETVGLLDSVEISSADVILNLRPWDDHGMTRYKAFLRYGYFNVVEDRFAKKYARVPEGVTVKEAPDDDMPF